MVYTNKAIALQKKKRATVSNKSLRAIETGDIQAVIDTLTPLQIRFCEEMVLDPKQGDAAVRAGYSPKTAIKQAYQMMENPAICLVIDKLRAERNKYADVTKDYVLDEIVKTVKKADIDNNHNAKLRGLELLAKHLGMFIDRTEISGPDGEAIRMEQQVKQGVADFTNKLSRLKAVGDPEVIPFPKKD